ncbi:MAG: helix-turn-helix transcriptional regulator [Paracoccaceae bacterium]
MREINTLGQELRTFRTINGLNQEAFAEKLGVDRTTLSAWERNAALPRPVHVKALITRGVVTKERARELVARAQAGYPVGKFQFRLSLLPPKSLLNAGVRFALNLVRPGPNTPENLRTDPVNIEVYFRPSPSRGHRELIAEIRRPDRKGFQFKCFAEFSDLDWQYVRDELTAAGYEPDDHIGDGDFQRLWFLYRDEETVTTPEGFIDNFYYPA